MPLDYWQQERHESKIDSKDKKQEMVLISAQLRYLFVESWDFQCKANSNG